MNDIEKRARELYANEIGRAGFANEAEIALGRGAWSPDAQVGFDISLRAIIAALTPPKGYVLVPVEPTEEMIRASMIRVELTKRCGPGTLQVLGARAWAAMLAARPEVTQ